jgi:hypothetical protein
MSSTEAVRLSKSDVKLTWSKITPRTLRISSLTSSGRLPGEEGRESEMYVDRDKLNTAISKRLRSQRGTQDGTLD